MTRRVGRRVGARATAAAWLLLVACGEGGEERPAARSGGPEDEPRPASTAPAEASAPGAAGPSDGAPRPAAPERVHEGVWSPDGERLAVTWDRGRGARLLGLLVGTDSTPRAAARGLPLSRGRGAWATWAPDGFWIAYEAGGDVHRMRPDGTGDEPLVSGPGAQSHPAWAPDGSRLALVEEDGGRSALRVVRPGGDALTRVPAPDGARWRAPAWTPSGEGLVVELSRPGGSTLHAVAAEGGPTRELVAGADPAFGPRGRLWWSRSDSIFRADWDDDVLAAPRLVVTPGRTPAPAPDGVRLAFVRDGADGAALWMLHLDTGGERRVTAPSVGPTP